MKTHRQVTALTVAIVSAGCWGIALTENHVPSPSASPSDDNYASQSPEMSPLPSDERSTYEPIISDAPTPSSTTDSFPSFSAWPSHPAEYSTMPTADMMSPTPAASDEAQFSPFPSFTAMPSAPYEASPTPSFSAMPDNLEQPIDLFDNVEGLPGTCPFWAAIADELIHYSTNPSCQFNFTHIPVVESARDLYSALCHLDVPTCLVDSISDMPRDHFNYLINSFMSDERCGLEDALYAAMLFERQSHCSLDINGNFVEIDFVDRFIDLYAVSHTHVTAQTLGPLCDAAPSFYGALATVDQFEEPVTVPKLNLALARYACSTNTSMQYCLLTENPKFSFPFESLIDIDAIEAFTNMRSPLCDACKLSRHTFFLELTEYRLQKLHRISPEYPEADMTYARYESALLLSEFMHSVYESVLNQGCGVHDDARCIVHLFEDDSIGDLVYLFVGSILTMQTLPASWFPGNRELYYELNSEQKALLDFQVSYNASRFHSSCGMQMREAHYDACVWSSEPHCMSVLHDISSHYGCCSGMLIEWQAIVSSALNRVEDLVYTGIASNDSSWYKHVNSTESDCDFAEHLQFCVDEHYPPETVSIVHYGYYGNITGLAPTHAFRLDDFANHSTSESLDPALHIVLAEYAEVSQILSEGRIAHTMWVWNEPASDVFIVNISFWGADIADSVGDAWRVADALNRVMVDTTQYDMVVRHLVEEHVITYPPKRHVAYTPPEYEWYKDYADDPEKRATPLFTASPAPTHTPLPTADMMSPTPAASDEAQFSSAATQTPSSLPTLHMISPTPTVSNHAQFTQNAPTPSAVATDVNGNGTQACNVDSETYLDGLEAIQHLVHLFEDVTQRLVQLTERIDHVEARLSDIEFAHVGH